MPRGKRPKHSTVKIEETPYRSSETQRRIRIKSEQIRLPDGRKTVRLRVETLALSALKRKRRNASVRGVIESIKKMLGL